MTTRKKSDRKGGGKTATPAKAKRTAPSKTQNQVAEEKKARAKKAADKKTKKAAADQARREKQEAKEKAAAEATERSYCTSA